MLMGGDGEQGEVALVLCPTPAQRVIICPQEPGVCETVRQLAAPSLLVAKAHPSLSKGSGSPSCFPEVPGLYPWQSVRPAWISGASLELHRSGALSASQASPTRRGATFQLWERLTSHALFSFASDVPQLPWW